MQDGSTNRPGHEIERANVAHCAECDCSSGLGWRGWRAYRIDDPELAEPPALAFYCPSCAEREFGEAQTREHSAARLTSIDVASSLEPAVAVAAPHVLVGVGPQVEIAALEYANRHRQSHLQTGIAPTRVDTDLPQGKTRQIG